MPGCRQMLEIVSLHDRHAIVDEGDLLARQLGQALAGGDMLEGNGVRAHDLDTQAAEPVDGFHTGRSVEHTSELQSIMRISYAVFCLKKKTISTMRFFSLLLRLHTIHT